MYKIITFLRRPRISVPTTTRDFDGLRRWSNCAGITIKAVPWSLSETEELFLDRSRRSGEHETALEEGWLVVELEHRFGYGLEELARRFNCSTSWVSQHMDLVEPLLESTQRQVDNGAITAHVAMKYLTSVARSRPDDRRRVAENFAVHPLRSQKRVEHLAAELEGSILIWQAVGRKAIASES